LYESISETPGSRANQKLTSQLPTPFKPAPIHLSGLPHAFTALICAEAALRNIFRIAERST
jgi:hypothetical protein